MLSNVAAPLSKFVHLLILRNCEYIILPGIRDFTDMIKVSVSWWGNHPGLPGCFQCNHVHPYKREARRSGREKIHGLGQKGGKLLLSWLWRRRKGPWAKEWRQPLDAWIGKEMNSPRKPLEQLQSCWHLDFSSERIILDIWCQDYKIIHLCCFRLLLGLWWFVTAAVGD